MRVYFLDICIECATQRCPLNWRLWSCHFLCDCSHTAVLHNAELVVSVKKKKKSMNCE